MEVPTLAIFCHEGRPPADDIGAYPGCRSQHLLDLLAQVPDPRKRRGHRHVLAGLLTVGIAAVIAGSRWFAAIGQWAADAGPEVLAVLGAARSLAEESTFRRAFAAWPSACCTWTATPTSPPPTATTPATRSAR